jgi:hypothetical protein
MSVNKKSTQESTDFSMTLFNFSFLQRLMLHRVNIMTESHILFSMEPKGLTKELRQISIPCQATDRIKDIILYAATEAGAQQQLNFYLRISKQPGFRTSAGKMFKEFVLSWLYAHSEGYLCCVCHTCLPDLGT